MLEAMLQSGTFPVWNSLKGDVSFWIPRLILETSCQAVLPEMNQHSASVNIVYAEPNRHLPT